MKKLNKVKLIRLLLVPMFFCCIKIYAQPAPYVSPTINYVRTWDAVAPETDPNNLILRPFKDVKQTTQYIDGLGRPIQTVARQASLETATGSVADIVAPILYDEFGREIYKYLPFVANTNVGNTQASTTDGNFKLNPFQQQAAFATNQYTGEANFYSKTNFEASPLNRPTDTYAPGSSWAGSEINTNPALQRNVQIKYYINTIIDDVKIWNVFNDATIGNFGTYQVSTNTNGSYPAGQLYKNITIDEHKKQIIEFKDKEGKVILKKVQIGSITDDGTGVNYTNFLCTYYIYDDLNNLRCVIQPEGVKQLPGNGNQLTLIILAEQCFRYEYDQRNRMVKKKVPGAGEVCMVYDERDRLILSQDANMLSQQKWMYTKYDELNRPIATGLWPSTLTQQQHAANSSVDLNYPTLSGQEELSNNFYNDYTWLSNYTTGLAATYNTTYDPYLQTPSTLWPYPQANTSTSQLKGMVTGGRTKVLGTANDYLYSIIFYDEKGRVIQSQNTNITGGKDISTTQYTWAGQPLVMVQRVEKAGTPINETVTVTKMTFDDLGRVVKTEKKISNSLVNGGAMPSSYKTIAENKYDKLGQLVNKTIGKKGTSQDPLAKLDYEYNIRGWLTSVNKNFVSTPTIAGNSDDRYFGMQLGYDKDGFGTFAKKEYNGNISGSVWRSAGDGIDRKYDYDYDAANRLLKADFTQHDGNAGNTFTITPVVNFNVKMGDGIDPNLAYDYNGNIQQMQQWGLKINTSSQIDNLKYSYNDGSNRLRSVIDFNNDASTKMGDFKTNVSHPQSTQKASYTPTTPQSTLNSIIDYGYDDNGNMNLDNNKGISGITYNHLNLPAVINIPNKGSITYTYDAGGNKLKKVTQENNASVIYDNVTYPTGITTTTSYVSGLVYESKSYSNTSVPAVFAYSDILQFVPQEEGRIRFKSADGSIAAFFAYDYMLKDHLGNVRMVLTDEVQTDKYPAATLEPSLVGVENTFYSINPNNIVANSAANNLRDGSANANIQTYPNNNISIPNNNTSCGTGTLCTTDNSAYVYKLDGSSSNRMGLGITLKVMAGDRIDVFGKSYWYETPTGPPPPDALPILNIITGFLGGTTGVGVTNSHGTVTNTQINPGTSNTAFNNFFNTQNTQSPPSSSNPKAFVNVIFFDEQFNAVDYKVSMVGSNKELKSHIQDLQNLIANKSGFVYIYCSNESPVNVFFDNLQVRQQRGAILEETHYYPFGLTMAGISSKAASFGNSENKYKWNKGSELQSKEFSDGSGLELYATNFRSLDPQIGRFWQTDPKPDFSQSLYSSMNNNPIMYNDPLGDTIRHSFRTGFLGIFGKKVNLTYDEKNKQWNNKDGSAYTGKTTKFSNMVLNDLQTNQKNDLGNAIVTNLATDKLDHNILKGDPNGNRTDNANIYYSGSISDNQKILEGGKTNSSPSYVVLGHEMAHKFMQNLGVVNKYWFGAPGEERGVDEYNGMYYENVLRQANGLSRRAAYQEINGVTQGTILNSAGNLQPMPPGLASQGMSMPLVHALQIFLRIF